MKEVLMVPFLWQLFYVRLNKPLTHIFVTAVKEEVSLINSISEH